MKRLLPSRSGNRTVVWHSPLRRSRSGLTLMEVAVSSLLVGTVLVMSLSTSASWRRFHQQNQARDITQRLANELVSEIMSTAFIDPAQAAPVALGLETGESAATRANWDDVDDYHGMNETVVRDKSGTVIADAVGYRRTVRVAAAIPSNDPPGHTVSSDLSSPLRSIVVTVISPSGQTATASGLKSNVASNFPSALNHVRSVTFEFNDAGRRTTRSIGLPNYPAGSP